MRKIVVLAIMGCLILATLHFQPVRAADCYVPSVSYPTIGAAYADSNCTTIYVAAGTYNENLDINRGLILIGAGASSTTINGVSGDTIDVFSIVTISGFTIRGPGTGIHHISDSGVVENNIITGNGAHGMQISSLARQNLIIRNNLIVRNGVDGIYLDNGAIPIITNNTISHNSDDNIDAGSGAEPTLTNNIITFTINDEGIQWHGAQSTYPIYNNDVFGNACDDWMSMNNLTGINGNISQDPLFVNSATNDFHLQKGSPAVNAGRNNAQGISSIDLEGNARISCGTVDMGAYEIQCPNAAEKRPQPPSLLPIASTNISKASSLLTQADSLLSDAKARNLDTATCEKLIDEAKADLAEAKLRLTSPTTANYFALRAAAKLKAALDCLKALIG
jgi:parallel beta-helix repeat protein